MATSLKPSSIDEVIREHPPSRDNLISILQDVQGVEGYLSRESINRISEYLHLPSSKIYGVATFYNQFKLNKPGKIVIQVCRGTACHVKGSANLLDSLKLLLDVDVGKTTKDGLFTLETIACLGGCSISPVITANGKFFGRLDKKKLEELVAKWRQAGEVVE